MQRPGAGSGVSRGAYIPGDAWVQPVACAGMQQGVGDGWSIGADQWQRRRHKKTTPACAGVVGLFTAWDQRPNSNTTSRLTDSVVSPGATEVSLAMPASADIIRIIGIGRGMLEPPSLMLTMRRTFKPSASA